MALEDYILTQECTLLFGEALTFPLLKEALIFQWNKGIIKPGDTIVS